MSRPYPPDPGRRPPNWQQQPRQYPPPETYPPPGHPYPPPGPPGPRGAPPQAPRPAPPEPPREGDGFRLPGLGLLLSLVSVAIQLLSLTVLPWLTSSASGESEALPKIWEMVKDFDSSGFSGAYVLLFSYPLAVLGIVLTLVSVLESVALKVIWAALTLIGLGVLVLRFGLWPMAEGLVSDEPLDLSSREITISIIALGALVAVIFMLKTAMAMFRRVAALLLLVLAAVHVGAVNDLADGSGEVDLSIGAWGPAAGYALGAIAAFIGPRRLA